MIPVILSGGSGTRLWPMSRAKFPKQFCEIFDESLQVLTLKRVAPLGTPWVIAAEKLRTHTENSARESGVPGVLNIYEPFGRNTAPAVALVCRLLELENKLNEVVTVLPADQLIQKADVFLQAIACAEREAQNDKVVTLGIAPTHAATGYGYIQTEGRASLTSVSVCKFHEKPKLEMAEEFLCSGQYFWNAGIFIFKASVMKGLFEKYQPEVWASFQKLKLDLSNLKDVYSEVKSISIDYAIIEKLSSELACVPCDLGWSDVGSWDAVAEFADHSNSQVIEVESKNNYVKTDGGKKIYALVGVEDLIVVDTDDALLIAKRDHSEGVKTAVQELSRKNAKVAEEHTFEDRPWGHYEILRDEQHYKSKVIEVSIGQQLSYQSHKNREEHWVIVRGEGQITLNDEKISVQAGSYIKIPTESRHRIRNTGREPLQFIEVQLGEYFGEDDIVRHQDDYNRL